MLAFGLVDREALRASLLRWMQRQCGTILSLGQARTLFLPKKRRYAEDLLFSLEELFPDGLPTSEIAVPVATLAQPPVTMRPALSVALAESIDSLVGGCMAGEGVLSAAVLDRETGACLAQQGHALNRDVIWTQIQSLNVLERNETVMDVTVATNARYHLLQVIGSQRKRLVYVVAETRAVTLAMLRINLQAVIRSAEESSQAI